jgi:hypothetical protein
MLSRLESRMGARGIFSTESIFEKRNLRPKDHLVARAYSLYLHYLYPSLAITTRTRRNDWRIGSNQEHLNLPERTRNRTQE